MNARHPKTIAIIVTYNGVQWIEKCLHHLTLSDSPVEIIVVDNASTDHTLKIVRGKFPQCEVIESPANLGFGKANNLGIDRAMQQQPDYLLLVNQDLYLEPDTLSRMIACHNKHPRAGVVSPMQFNGSGEDLDLNFRRVLQSSSTYFEDCIKSSIREAYHVHFAMAAIWLLPVNSIRIVGKFNPIFYHYAEDNDYCNRILYHGMTITVCPEAKAYHDRDSRTRSSLSQMRIQFSQLLAHTLNINRNAPVALGRMLVYHNRYLVKAILKGDLQLLRLVISSSMNQIRQLPEILSIRRASKRPATLSEAGLLN